jgi:hypothetical protein
MSSVVKSRIEGRRSWLGREGRAFGLPPRVLALAEGSEDAFDATVAALALAGDFQGDLPAIDDITVRREGWIWGVPFVGL